MSSVYLAAANVLRTANPHDKCKAAHDLATGWAQGHLTPEPVGIELPDRPARPKAPVLVAPTRVKRRGLGTVEGRGTLLHAIAHIEFNAIDLAADMIARFGCDPLISPSERAKFAADWIRVCDDEARHFELLQDRLGDIGITYGDQSAHDGLWQAALATKDDLVARLVIAPMVLEARGLDVTPGMIKKLQSVKDHSSADILQTIYDEEIGHVATGSRWFRKLTDSNEAVQTSIFHQKVRKYFNGLLKPPFNQQARDLAGIPVEFYAPLTQAL